MKPRINKAFFAIDIINIIICALMLCLSVFTFLDIAKRTAFFPYIILMGAIVNALSGYKEIKQSNKKGRVFFVVGGILFIISLVIFGGFGGF